MKFGKHLKRQKVPEWTDAYVDYNGLKRILGQIMSRRQTKEPTFQAKKQKLVLCKSFSGLNVPPPSNLSGGGGDVEDQVIDVNSSQHEGSCRNYRTNFLRQSEEGGDLEALFFQQLDDELNKVNKFYRDKVEEVMQEADSVNKQMEALIALRIRVEKPDRNLSKSKKHGSSGVDREPSENTEKESISAPELSPVHINVSDGSFTERPNERREDPLEILEHVKFNKVRDSPISTIKGVFKESKNDELSLGKEELRIAVDRLRRVFKEFYQSLRLLRHYSFMNLSAFAKILKKYEKVTSRMVSRSYMKIVESSHIGSSDEVTAFMERVEAVFIKHFSNSNRREGMKSLRSKVKREKHRVTFLSGFFSGCSIALIAALVLKIEARNLMEKREGVIYMANVFPLYSFFGYVVLHMLVFAANLYCWKRYKVNYQFIFGFKQGTDLGYHDVFLLSSGLAVLSLASFLANLNLDLAKGPRKYQTFAQSFPLGLVIVVLAILFCPFNIIYRSNRIFFIRCLFRCICAPLYRVRQPDFFLADHLTSQVQAIRCLELYICHYGLGEYSQRSRCHSHSAYNVFYFIVAIIPYWIRFLQCLRRLWEDRDLVQGYNGFKYFLTIFAVVLRTTSELKKGTVWLVLGLVSSALAMLMNMYWDIVMDWGLLRRRSKNFYLRDKLLVSHKSIYYAAMVLNVVLRLAWMQLVLEFKCPAMEKMAALTSISCLEIVRRGIWSFFRLENEHLNNVDHYRAFKSVPHPFSYYDEDESEKDD